MGNIRNVRRISKEKGISYAFICKKIGRSHGYLSEIESRDADVPRKSVPLIAEALGVSEEEITGEPLTSNQKIDDLAASVPMAMYDGNQYKDVPEDIKQLAAAFALAKKEQEIKDPALRKIIDVCKSNPEYIKPLSIMLDQLVSAVERKGGDEK